VATPRHRRAELSPMLPRPRGPVSESRTIPTGLANALVTLLSASASAPRDWAIVSIRHSVFDDGAERIPIPEIGFHPCSLSAGLRACGWVRHGELAVATRLPRTARIPTALCGETTRATRSAAMASPSQKRHGFIQRVAARHGKRGSVSRVIASRIDPGTTAGVPSFGRLRSRGSSCIFPRAESTSAASHAPASSPFG
jgi:hypothetical protein